MTTTNPRTVACPMCKRKPGQCCLTRNARPMTDTYHMQRYKLVWEAKAR